MDDVERALSEIADIRARVTASSRFRGFAPETMVSGSLLSLTVAAAQTLWPQALAADAQRYVAVWGVAFLGYMVLSAIGAVARCRSLHGRLAEAMFNSTLRQLLPFAAAGAAIALLLCKVAPGEAWLVPGLWQVLVALAGFSVAANLPRAIVWPSAWYFFTGVLAIGVAAHDGGLSPWMMGLPFAIGQAAVALVLVRAGGGSDGRR